MKPRRKTGSQTIDITGQVFNRWTVIRFTEIRKEKSYFLCRCLCGTEKEITGNSLKTGASKSCGCLHSEIASQTMSINRKDNRLAVGEASFNDLLSRYKRGAQERDLLFDLTVEEFRELTSAKCSYCGIEPAQINHKSNTFGAYIYNGIDRIDNSLGYIKSNCISCCERCNEWKRALTKNEFLNHVKRIYLCMLQ